ncbi:MAG: DNA mismatch repair endonuclease MutL [Spirochaetaceae bacterium]|jgi:DNA mismatch repair protein MutL|nr:DNA mismatch repair endonuclease MutL [Spirochaetaceae bacterium]
MIRILPPEEAKKIAAGEVIDRPAALVREFIDNALDSGAGSIELAIEGGGIGKVEVIDDGSGMSREDLALCVKTHATSKIQSLDDLSRSTTLGFRGEALAAAASVARLEILTSTDGREAWLLETIPGAAYNGVPAAGEAESDSTTFTQTRRIKGTSIRAYGLFDAIPARKRFLKREAAETALCRQTFIEKALAFPGVSFRFIQDGVMKLQLLPCSGGPMKRFGELFFSGSERKFLHLIEAGGEGFTVTIIFGGPELYRQDRRQQYIFANKRRVQDYGLMQALEYGLSGYFPNSSHPVGAVFIEVDPALADFNIHPAKREIRFADSAAIHHCITTALRGYVQKAAPWIDAGQGGHEPSQGTLSQGDHSGTELPFRPPYQRGEYFSSYAHSLAMEALLERRNDFAPLPKAGAPAAFVSDPIGAAAEPEPAYYTGGMDGQSAGTVHAGSTTGQLRLAGRAFGFFIIAEKGNKLYLIDQHAAHERLLYNHFLSAPITTQELLVAIPFTASDAEEENFLQAKQEELKRLGIVLENGGGGDWRITALPAGWKAGDGETVEELLSLRTAGKNLAERWAAALACRTAIKDGGWLDDEAALALAEAALALEEETGQLPRCPHGRPLWTEIRREELFKAVRRV